MTIEDDIEWDDDDDDGLAITEMTELATSCIVMKEHMDKRKQRQKRRNDKVIHLQFQGKECPSFLSNSGSPTLISSAATIFHPLKSRISYSALVPMLSYQQRENNSTEWSHSFGDQTPCIDSFIAGGSAYNVFPLFGMGHTSLFRCVWAIVRAINETLDMRIDFPMEHFKQQQIVHGFIKKPSV